MIKSIYIHIPFCHHICSYCDFTKLHYSSDLVDKYLEALEKEINEKYKGEIIDTLYIGGGTPSFLNTPHLNKLFQILKKIKLSNNYEYTIECNIEDIVEEKLNLFKEKGINRISIGIQTFNDKFLQMLDRPKVDFASKILLAKKYFDNINVDLMYAFKDQTISDLDIDLNHLLKLDIPHISIYSLIIEKHTKLYIEGVKPINEELDSEMFYHIRNRLTKAGYKHYEISNYAKDGYQSKHNLTYWNNEHYYGLGLGASGYIDKVRYTNTKNINKYLEGFFEDYNEKLTQKDIISYEMILGLRKIDGLDMLEFKKKYKKNINDIFNIEDLIDNNIMTINKGKIFINEKYLYVSNSILERFI